jgi:hypothetical protein
MYPKAAIGLAVFESFSSRETYHVSGREFKLGIFYKGNTVVMHAMKAYGKLVLVLLRLGLSSTTRPLYFQGTVHNSC